MTTQQRRELKPGELFAIDPKYLQQTERGAFFWMFGSPVQRNETFGDVAVVHVRDVLDHHEGWGDSYDALVLRIQAALDGDEDCKRWDQMAEWYGVEEMTAKKGARPEPKPAKTIVLAIDSPGGVVSGLNQTVEKIRRMCAEKKVPLIAFANEKACSAAYALACACEKIYAPPSAIIGSIGVRSMMCDQTRADKKAGLTYVLIASGERKLDGDPHQPIADAAVKEEQGRVDYLANQFFSLVGQARGDRLTAEKAKALQANVLIGKKAKNAGLIDEVIGWDALLAKLTEDAKAGAGGTPAQQNSLEKPKPSGISDRSGTAGAIRHTPTEKPMRLTKKIQAVKAALASETDAKKKEKLREQLATLRSDDAILAAAEGLKKTKYKHETEVEETEEDDKDPDSEEEETEEEETDEDKDKDAADPDKDKDAEDPPEKKKSKKAEKDPDKDPDSEDEDKDKDAEEEKSEEEALSALTGHLKGKEKQKALGFLSALVGKAKAFDQLQPQVAQLKATEEHRKRSALIDDALKSRRITKKHAKDLRDKPLAFVKDFLKMHTKALYFTDADALLPGEGGPEAVSGRVPDVVMQVIDQSSAAFSTDPKKREEYKRDAIKRWHETQNGARH